MESANTRIKILTVDDHPVLREGIAALLEGQEDMILVAEAVNGREGNGVNP
jgi:DNA-binding NarL/FixJ family response regulator